MDCPKPGFARSDKTLLGGTGGQSQFIAPGPGSSPSSGLTGNTQLSAPVCRPLVLGCCLVHGHGGAWDAELAYTHTSLTDTGDVVATHADGAEPIWRVYQFHPSAGMEIHHAVPHALLEWRCALYGLDPDDVPTLLDTALHEPCIPGGNDVFTRTGLGAAKVLEVARSLPTCWTPGVPEHERARPTWNASGS